MGFQDYEWLIGAVCAAVGSMFSNLGVNTQKYSFMQNDMKPKSEQKPYSRQPYWILGLCLVILGSIGDFVAMGMAALSIVAPVGSITLVTNIFFAHFWLNEEVSINDFLGIVCIIGGSIMAVMFGDHDVHVYTLVDLMNYYSGQSFIIYAVTCGVLVLASYIKLRQIEHKKLRIISLSAEYDLAFLQHNFKQMNILDTQIDAAEKDYAPHVKTHPLCYCIISGTMGGQNILFGKMVAELLETTLRGDNQLFYGMTWFFVGCMLISIFSQLHFLAKALQYFDAMYVVPVFQCFWISVSTIAGAAYFQEFSTFSTDQSILFGAGICVTLSGVYVLSARKMHKKVERMDTASYIIAQKVSRHPSGLGAERVAKPNLVNSNRKYGLLALEEEPEDLEDGEYDENKAFVSYQNIMESSLDDGGTTSLTVASSGIEDDEGNDHAKLQVIEEVVVLAAEGEGYVVYVPKVASKKQRDRLLQEARIRYENAHLHYLQDSDVETEEDTNETNNNSTVAATATDAKNSATGYQQEAQNADDDANTSNDGRANRSKSTNDATDAAQFKSPRGRSKSGHTNGAEAKQDARTSVKKSHYARMRAASTSRYDGASMSRSSRRSLDAERTWRAGSVEDRGRRRSSAGLRANDNFFSPVALLAQLNMTGQTDELLMKPWNALPEIPLPSFMDGDDAVEVKKPYMDMRRSAPSPQGGYDTIEDEDFPEIHVEIDGKSNVNAKLFASNTVSSDQYGAVDED